MAIGMLVEGEFRQFEAKQEEIENPMVQLVAVQDLMKGLALLGLNDFVHQSMKKLLDD